jgi:Domain of unknown function (DUF4160)
MQAVPQAGYLSYSREGHEPPHIQVEHGDKVAKYWLETRLHSIAIAHRQAFLAAWDEHFGGKNGSHGS